jgi:hypothetical protein
VGREWPAVTAEVAVVLPPFQDLEWEAEFDFVLEEGLPLALLGYEGFLNRWAVSFNAYMGYFIIEPAEIFDDRQPEEVFEELRANNPSLFSDQ